MLVRVKRVYEKPSATDGCRILVDRIWPRGLNKQTARIDSWPKEIAPTTQLRKWFHHDPAKWKEFKKRYFQELNTHPEQANSLIKQTAKGPVTLVFGAKDEQHNNAIALKEYLDNH